MKITDTVGQASHGWPERDITRATWNVTGEGTATCPCSGQCVPDGPIGPVGPDGPIGPWDPADT